MRRFLTVLALPLVLVACVQSVHPLYTNETLVAEPALLGTWMSDEGDLLVVSEQDSLTYRLVMVDADEAPSVWTGRVTVLDGRRWLDVEPEELPDQWTAEYRDAFLPLHQFWLLQRVDSVLLPASLAYDSVKALLDRDPPAAAHSWVQENLLLLADTPELRAFVAAVAARPGYLEAAEPMRRVSVPR